MKVGPIIVAITRDVITVFTVYTVTKGVKSKFCKIIKSVSMIGRRMTESFLMENVILKILLKYTVLKEKQNFLS
jgi:hypothetical protein